MPLTGSQFLAVAAEAPDAAPRPFGLRALLARQAPRSSTGLLARFASGYLVGGIPEPDPVLYSQRSGAMPSAYALTDLITTARTSKATYFDGLGQIREANNNVPLLTFDPLTLKSLGLLSQRATTNYCNTRCEGARVGTVMVDGAASSVGALPTGMSAPGNGGLTLEVTRIIAMGDASAVEIRARGIATGDLRMYLAGAAAEQGDWFSTSGMIMAAAGVQPGCSWAIRSLTSFPSNLLGPLARSWQRVRSVRQLSEASPGEARIELRFYLTAGQPYDWTFRLFIPALEKSALCSYAPMLPPIGSPTAPVTRAADLYTITDLARIAFNGLAGTFVFRFWLDSLPVATGTAEQLGLFLTYSGSTASFMRLTGRYNGVARIEAGSDATVTLDSGGLVTGENTLAYSFSQERMSLSVNGNDTVSAVWGSVTPPSAADGLRLGDMSTANTRKLNGPISLFTYSPVETTGADLKAASAAALTM